MGWTTLILKWEEDEQKGLQEKTPSWKQQYLCLVYSHYFHLCFTFTAQIMHRIPILMSYFVDHYARLLVSWFLLLHERLEKYILCYGYQGLLVACLVLLYVCLFLVCWWITEVKKVKSTLKLNVYQKNERAIQFYLREEFSIQSESLDSNTGEKELIMVWKR